MPIFLVSYFIDIFISDNLKKSNIYAQEEYTTWNDLFNGKINSDIVIYGSSRAWTQIDPVMISNSLHIPTYNLGIDGHNFWLQYLRHLFLLKNNQKPKLIVQSLDIYTLGKRSDLYNPDQFLPYMLWNNEIKNATISYNGFNLIDYEIPLIRYFGKSDAILTALNLFIRPQSNKVGRINGYQAKDLSWNGDFEKAQKAMKFYEVSLDTATINLFERFLKEVEKNNIKIMFVYSPEYIEGQKFVKNRNPIIKLYQEISKKHNIPFYDYSSDSISLNKNYFYNASHLNKTGAELFTKKLIRNIASIINKAK